MMKFTSLLHKRVRHESVEWHDSSVLSGVRFGIRRVSLNDRIELTERARDLCRKNEFLRAGDAGDQLESSLSDLLVRKLYLEWGLVEIDGLEIDGRPATPENLIKNGPETLSNEIIVAIQAQLGLTEDERKNS